ncbi:MAG TPA: hypothetical protein VKZ62_00030 [Georgenia sp.]|nr:hypothetical protein [Georgenia sp.]
MKVINFDEKLAEKKKDVKPEVLISHLYDAIKDGKVESVLYVTKNKDGTINLGFSTMEQSQVIGYLEIGKRIMLDSMYEE